MANNPPIGMVRGSTLFCQVDPNDLSTLDDWAECLDSLLHGDYTVEEIDGCLVRLEERQHVEKVRGLRMEIYSKEHPPPHFHVKSQEVDASFKIEDCSLLHGEISGKDRKKVEYWYRTARQKLIDTWDSTRPGDCPVGCYQESPSA